MFQQFTPFKAQFPLVLSNKMVTKNNKNYEAVRKASSSERRNMLAKVNAQECKYIEISYCKRRLVCYYVMYEHTSTSPHCYRHTHKLALQTDKFFMKLFAVISSSSFFFISLFFHYFLFTFHNPIIKMLHSCF